MSFLGRGWSFPPRFDANKRLVMVENFEDIEESLRLLLATRCGERIMQPGYGTTLHRLVFENADASLLTALKDMLKKAVMLYEPRVEPGLPALPGPGQPPGAGRLSPLRAAHAQRHPSGRTSRRRAGSGPALCAAG